MDRNIIALKHQYNDQDNAINLACISAAYVDLHSEDEALNCSDGKLRCSNCPLIQPSQELAN